MPRDKDLKRIIRRRMEKTGEAYTTARAHTVAESTNEDHAGDVAAPTSPEDVTSAAAMTPDHAGDVEVPASPDHAASAAATLQDYAALAGMRDEVIAAKTGRDWAAWVRTLDAVDAHTLTHTAIARIVHEQYGVGDWWTQAVTVGYERIRGLRERGQRRAGDYEIGRSRTFGVPVDVLFDAWADDAARGRWLTGAAPVVRTATKPKSMRLGWEDGTLVALYFTAKGATKSSVAVQHTKLADRATGERLKAYWSERLDALAEVLRTHGPSARGS